MSKPITQRMAPTRVNLRRICAAVLPLIFSLGLHASVHAQEPVPLTLAVVPQLPPLTTHKAWAPFVERLEKETGLRIKLSIYKTVPEFEVDMLAGKPDLVFMNPYHQIMAKKAQGYVPLVRATDAIFGVVVVARDGPIKTMADLNGQEIAFPSPNAYAASLYVRALLSEQFALKYKPRFLDTHTDVYRHIILGQAAAGGAVNTTFNRESDDIRAQLHILYTTPAAAPHPLSAHPRVPAQHQQNIIASILRLGADPANQELLKGVLLKQPVAADYRKDYQPLEKLGLEKYVVISR